MVITTPSSSRVGSSCCFSQVSERHLSLCMVRVNAYLDLLLFLRPRDLQYKREDRSDPGTMDKTLDMQTNFNLWYLLK